jgi:hypothetical protein
LTSQLEAAAADIGLLLSRLDAKSLLEESNLGLVKELRRSAVARLGAIRAAIAAAAAAQSARFADARRALEEFAARKAATGAEIGQGLGEVLAQGAAMEKAAEGAVAQVEGAALAGLQVELGDGLMSAVCDGVSVAPRSFIGGCKLPPRLHSPALISFFPHSLPRPAGALGLAH